MPHSRLHVERRDGRLVGRCECGWTTTPAASGGRIGSEWDDHRAEHERPVTDATG